MGKACPFSLHWVVTLKARATITASPFSEGFRLLSAGLSFELQEGWVLFCAWQKGRAVLLISVPLIWWLILWWLPRAHPRPLLPLPHQNPDLFCPQMFQKMISGAFFLALRIQHHLMKSVSVWAFFLFDAHSLFFLHCHHCLYFSLVGRWFLYWTHLLGWLSVCHQVETALQW